MKTLDTFPRFFRLILCLVVFAAAGVGRVDAENSSTSMADTLYMHGEYAEAAEAYLAIAKVDGVSPQLLFNLANSYAQTGDLGSAMLYYSRANRLAPADKDIKNNLNYFASKVEDSNRAELRGRKISVAPDHKTFFQSVNEFICADFPLDMWAYIGLASFLLLLVLISLYLFCSDVRLRKIGFFGGLAAFVITVVSVSFAFMSASYHDAHDRAILMAYKTELLIEPSSDAKPASSLLCQGTALDVIAEETDVEGKPTWYKVRLNSEIEGWLRASDIELI